MSRTRLLAAVAVAVAAVAVALLLVLPRDDPEDSFAQRAGAVCVEGQKQLVAIPRPTNLQELAETSISTSAITARMGDELRAIEATPARREDLNRLANALDGQARLMRRVQRAILDDRQDEALALVRRGARLERRAADLADELSLSACAVPRA